MFFERQTNGKIRLFRIFVAIFCVHALDLAELDLTG